MDRLRELCGIEDVLCHYVGLYLWREDGAGVLGIGKDGSESDAYIQFVGYSSG